MGEVRLWAVLLFDDGDGAKVERGFFFCLLSLRGKSPSPEWEMKIEEFSKPYFTLLHTAGCPPPPAPV